MLAANEKKPLTVAEAAPLLRLSAASVYALCAAKKLRHQRVGVGRGKIIIPSDSIDEYLSKRTIASIEGAPAAPAQKKGKAFTNLDSERLLAAWREQEAV